MSEKNSQDEKIVKVHAYLAGFLPDLIIGIQKDGIWYLPGGIVNGIPRSFPDSSQVHFYTLANYLKQQTGLILTGLTDAQQLTFTHFPTGTEATILYFGSATGEISNGVKLDINNLPDFAVECGNPRGTIEKLMQPPHKTESASSKS